MVLTVHHLLTGPPGVGKSTVIQRLIEIVGHKGVRGFWTGELREHGQRVGFAITTLDGKQGILAHVRFGAPPRVGRYGVDVEGFERIALPELEPRPGTRLIIIDEIGRMECYSKLFQQAVRRLLDGPTPLVGTIAQKGNGLIAYVKQQPAVRIWTVSTANRDQLPAQLAAILNQNH